MKNKIAIGFILYHPSEKAINRIVDVINDKYEIFIFLNSILSTDQISKLEQIQSINIFHYKGNNGLAEGLNALCLAAVERQYGALLYFDQDTVFTIQTLKYISSYFDYFQSNKNEITQTFSCTTFRDDIAINSKLNYISNFQISQYKVDNVYFSINSGSLYFLEHFNKFQWFDSKFFVDGIDYFFCISSIRRNFRITEIRHTPGLDHESEQGNVTIDIFKKKQNGRLYTLQRNKDFIRSHLILLFLSFAIKSFKPKLFLLRAIMIYLIQQIYLRIKRNLI